MTEPVSSQSASTPTASALAGAPVWIELFSSDLDRADRFYGELLGWSAAHMGPEYGNYVQYSRDGKLAAGGMPNDGSSGGPDAWSVYLSTDDVEGTTASVTAHGGAVLVPPMPVMDLGTMAVYADPGQHPISAWQPGTHPGFGALAEPGFPAWFELHTRGYDQTVQFYRDAFGWDAHTASDAEDFRYTTLGEGASQSAGIMDVSRFPDDHHTGWSIYFTTEDTDASVAQGRELGATVIRPPEDTPFGRLATLADPTGIVFKLSGPTG
ncbi:VOC family protein [Rhodococcus sp. X156]|uniref:VOC family protein n=1 Tax=Rhodococcus sp. X156 TaxID=2499145 RepID=UPI000FD842F2|nr:VOC family protein [Rhodococcus sp. X156]